MKKLVSVVLMFCLAMTMLVGCGGETLEANSRVQDGKFTFSSAEFKELYNQKASKKFQLTDYFKEKKADDSDFYMAFDSFDQFSVSTYSNEENGKLYKVSFSYKGGETSSDGSLGQISFTEGQMNEFLKYATTVYSVCSPNVSSSEFKAFFDTNIKNTGLLKESSAVIGDVEVTFDPSTGMDIDFEPVTK